MADEETKESEYAQWQRQVEEAAIDFGKLCLLRPKSHLVEVFPAVEFGKPPFVVGQYRTKITKIDYFEIPDVLPVVEAWCRQNRVFFSIQFGPDGYQCKFQADRPDSCSYDTRWHDELAGLLLMGCVAISKTLESVHTLEIESPSQP